MEWSFKHQGQALPPWRETGAMMTKWRPRAPQADKPAGGSPAGSPPAACCCQAGPAAATGCCGGGLRSPNSVVGAAGTFDAVLQRAALTACNLGSNRSAPSTPTHQGDGQVAHAHPAASLPHLARRTSLLSRSLEAAGVRRMSTPAPSHLAAPSSSGADWWQPRTHVVRPVRRST